MKALFPTKVQNKNSTIASLTMALLVSTCLSLELVARTITVTNTCDNGQGSLREAINLANESDEQSYINFHLEKKDSGYDTCTRSWCIKPSSPLPTIAVPLTIDGYTQCGALANTNQADQPDNACIKIALCGPGLNSSDPLDDERGLLFGAGSNGSEVKGLAIGDFPVGVEIQSNNSYVKGCFLGVGVDGATPKHNTISVLIACQANGTCIGTAKPQDRNVIGGLGFKRSSDPKYPCPKFEQSGAVTIFGSNTSVQQTTVGLTSTGTTAIDTPPTVPTPPVAGVVAVQTSGTTIGTPTPSPTPTPQPVQPSPVVATTPPATVTIAAFPTNVVVAQPTTTLPNAIAPVVTTTQVGTTISGNQASSALSSLINVNVIGVLNELSSADAIEQKVSCLITDSLISGASQSGIVISGLQDYPLNNVSIVRNRVGTDKTGMKPLPNGQHGIHIVYAAGTAINDSLIHYNGEHGVFLEQSLRTNISNSSVSYNGKDGINVSNATSGKDGQQGQALMIVGAQANECTCTCTDTCCCFKLDSNGIRVCCS